MLFPFFPVPAQSLTIWVMKDPLSVAFIVFEVSNVGLTVGPHVRSLAVFAPIGEPAEEKPAIRPLEQAFTMHSVLDKRSLVNFTSRSDPTTPSINLAFVELTLKNGVIWENLKAHPVWLGAFKTDLTAILGSTLAIIPVLTHNPLRADFIFLVEMLIVVKWPQCLIDVFHSLIFDVIDHKLVILKSEIVVYLLYVRIEPFP